MNKNMPLPSSLICRNQNFTDDEIRKTCLIPLILIEKYRNLRKYIGGQSQYHNQSQKYHYDKWHKIIQFM
jgi:hypothetical protein